MRKRRLILLICWILSVVMISTVGGTISYGLFFFVTSIPFFCLAYLLFVLWQFKIYQKTDQKSVVVGERIPYYFVLFNDSLVPFASLKIKMFSSFSYVEAMPDRQEHILLPKTTFLHDTNVICKYRGTYKVGVKEVEIGDFFGLFCMKYRLMSTVEKIVKPRIVTIHKISGLEMIHMSIKETQLLNGAEPDVTTKEYTGKDPMRMINWKISAKAGQLRVRNTVIEKKQGISILLDTMRTSTLEKEYLPIENKMLELAIALLLFYSKQDIPVGIFFEQEKFEHIKAYEILDFERCYDLLSEVSFDLNHKLLLDDRMILQNQEIVQSKIVFVITARDPSRLGKMIDGLQRAGVYTVLYVIGLSEGEKLPGLLGGKLVYISPEAELDEVSL